eukprot:8223612-Lingulodinium_polyedra.AAC.1
MASRADRRGEATPAHALAEEQLESFPAGDELMSAYMARKAEGGGRAGRWLPDPPRGQAGLA